MRGTFFHTGIIVYNYPHSFDHAKPLYHMITAWLLQFFKVYGITSKVSLIPLLVKKR